MFACPAMVAMAAISACANPSISSKHATVAVAGKVKCVTPSVLLGGVRLVNGKKNHELALKSLKSYCVKQ